MARTLVFCALLLRCTAEAHVADDSVLVQSGVQLHQHSASATSHLSRMELVKRVATNEMPLANKLLESVLGDFNCTAFPNFCRPPFNCQDWSTPGGLTKITLAGLAPGGKPNFGIWCAVPTYYDYMDACIIQKDLVKAGHIQYQWSLNAPNHVDEADGSYCFIEGHCSNEAVTNETTVEEANQMCDERYGRKGWSELGKTAHAMETLKDMQGMSLDNTNGFKHGRHTTIFLKAACAMGNYHCDVMYCKETYCKKPYYIKKYGHLLPRAPGHLLQSREWLD